MNSRVRGAVVFCSLSLSICCVFSGTQRVNPHAKLIAGFQNRVASYVKLRSQAEAELQPLKPTESAQMIAQHEHVLAQRIRALRPNARQGEIFTPAIRAEFRRLMKMASREPDASRIRRSLADAEPVAVPIHVNDAYPASVPLQSTPATLLRNLPVLPPQLEYRVVGHDLVLLDVGANLIVDFAPRMVQ